MRIAVDVMGGDHGSAVVVGGVQLALEEIPAITEVILVGREEEIEPALSKHPIRDPRLRILPATEVLTMEDKPIVGLRKKKDCSILRAVDLVKSGQAEAVV